MAEQDWKSSSRGDAAWKETMERVASRNTEARKRGRLERDAYERSREEARRTSAAKRHAKLMKSRTP